MTDLNTIAGAIREQLNRYSRARKLAYAHALEAGKLLIEAKKTLRATAGHGHWGAWLRDNFDMAERSAQVFMKLARAVAKGESAESAEMTIRDALESARVGNEEPDRKVGPPYAAFPLISHIKTQFCCPMCEYEWNGSPFHGRKGKSPLWSVARRIGIGRLIELAAISDPEVRRYLAELAPGRKAA